MRRTIAVQVLVVMVIVVLTGSRAVAQEAEIAPFRITDLGGHLALRYYEDGQKVGDPATGQSKQTYRTYEEELMLNAAGYVYHPNLMSFDIGGGPLGVQNEYESTAGNNDDSKTLYNLTARTSFFGEKAYPFGLYYEHLNPTVTLGLTQRFLQENTKVGATASLRQPLLPFYLTVDGFRLTSEGERITDEPGVVTTEHEDREINQHSLNAYRSFGALGYFQFLYQSNNQDTERYDSTQTLYESSAQIDTYDLSTRTVFGSRNEYSLVNLLSWARNSYSIGVQEYPERTDLRFVPDLRVQHSETTSSFYRYELYQSEEATREVDKQNGAIGFSYRSGEHFTFNMDVHGEDNQATDLTQKSWGSNAGASYVQPWGWALFKLSYGIGYDYLEQVASPQISNYEIIVLSGVVPVQLEKQNIDVSTIRVRDAADLTNEFVRGTDYDINIIGNLVEVYRIATGTIVDGSSVRVDYVYITEGTVSYSTLNQNIQAGVTVFRYTEVYARYHSVKREIDDGQANLALNDVQSTTYGLRMDAPFWETWMFGLSAMLEKHDEDIAPYERESYDTYLHIPLPLASSLRLTGRRHKVDNLNSDVDVDTTGYAAYLRSRPWYQFTVSAESSYDRDTGAINERELRINGLGIEWRLRQLSAVATMRNILDTVDNYEREKNVIRVVVKREF